MLLVPLFSAKLVAVLLAFTTWMLDFGASKAAFAYLIFGLATFAMVSLVRVDKMNAREHEEEIDWQLRAMEEQRRRQAFEAVRH